MTIKCIIIDDEPSSVDVLQDFIGRISFLSLKGSFKNISSALQYLNDNEIDLLFVDIKENDISAIESLKSLDKKPLTIFTSNHKELAIEGFDNNALDYLLKPLIFSRFVIAVSKANEYVSFINGRAQTCSRKNDFIFIKAEYKIIKVEVNSILFVESLKDYSKIYLKDNTKPIFTLQNLKSLESKLPSDSFIRIHRSYIVSVNKIDTIYKNRVTIGQKEIPVSTGFKSTLLKLIENHS